MLESSWFVCKSSTSIYIIQSSINFEKISSCRQISIKISSLLRYRYRAIIRCAWLGYVLIAHKTVTIRTVWVCTSTFSTIAAQHLCLERFQNSTQRSSRIPHTIILFGFRMWKKKTRSRTWPQMSDHLKF